MRIGITNVQGFLALTVRRKWWIIVPFLALSGGIAVLSYVLPRTYVSQAAILVQPRDVPNYFVMDMLVTDAEERLRSIEQTVLSRTNLLQILREFEDSLPEFRRLNVDQKVLKLRADIQILFNPGIQVRRRDSPPLTLFQITYQNQNPELAQKIASKLTTLFIEQDNRARETQVFGTTEFLSAELTKIFDRLSVSETKLKEVKSSRIFELPDQRQVNLSSLERLSNDKKANAEALDRNATTRLNVETQIAQTPEFLPAAAPAANAPPATATDALIVEYRKVELEYNAIAGKYTALHPEVQLAISKLERLKKQLPPEALAKLNSDGAAELKQSGATPSSSSAMLPNPLYQRLTAQLRDLNTELEIRQREKNWIESEIAKYVQRIENTPRTEQEISDVLRENADLKKQYDDLNVKLGQARLSESLESRQKGAQFVVVDPANYPLEPAKPNKLAVILGGAFASLLLAIGFAAAVDIARQRIWHQSEIETFWNVPVLVDIPEIVTDSDLIVHRRKRFAYMASSLTATAGYGFCLYMMYLKHESILIYLDPVLQPLVYR